MRLRTTWGLRLSQYKSNNPRCVSESIRSMHTAQIAQRQAQQNLLPKSDPPPPPAPAHLDRTKVTNPRHERQLLRSRVFPVGSRRLRAAIQSSPNIPFELLPYQCFQEARKVLQADRVEKVKQIERERARIERLKSTTTSNDVQHLQKQNRLRSMQTHLEKLKIFADINDPLVKKRFEDGIGDMDRPIYRHLAERKWRARKRLILDQRMTQMHLVPDVLAHVDISADIDIYFRGKKDAENKRVIPRVTDVSHNVVAQPGEFVASKVSEQAPDLDIQVFNRGSRLVTIAVVDADVPDLEKDSFDFRCHFLAANVPISPTLTKVRLASLDPQSQVIMPWMAPYSIKGAPYHRLSIFVLEQFENATLDVQDSIQKEARDGFKLRAFVTHHRLTPITGTLFRTEWDEWMDDVMQRHGYEGSDLEFKRKKVEPLPYKKKDGKRYR